MSKHLSVDIIVTTRNNAAVLHEALKSIAKQTFLNYQCYVVDDCSTDETVKMVKNEFPWVKILEMNKPKGPSQNRNLAIALGNAPFIVTLDDDVVLPPNWLKEMIDSISFSPVVGAVGSQLRFWHSQDTLNGIAGFFGTGGVGGNLFFNTPLYKVQSLLERPMRIVYACSAAMIMRRNAFKESGSFDPIYFYLAEDYDLGLRMNLCGYLVVYNPRAIAYHHYHKTANTFPKRMVNYLCYRNSLLTILKNFSVYTVLKMLLRFISYFRRQPLVMFKCFVWNLSHMSNIFKWRRYIRKHQLINESQILALDSFILSLSELGKRNSHKKKIGDVVRKAPTKNFFPVDYLQQKFHNFKTVCRHVDNIIFLVTDLCNLHCKQCFLHDVLNKEMEKNLILDEIKKFFMSLGRVNNIVLGGGEPFLRNDLDDICIALDRISTPSCITISTNGTNPDVIFQQVKTILESTRTNLKISLSLDGPPEVHNDIRKSPGLFDKVKETYERLSFLYYIFNPRLILQINSTVFADNYCHFLELYHLVKKQFSLANFTFEIIRGHYDTNAIQPISEDMYSDLIECMSRLDDLASLKLHRLALKTIKQEKQVVPCNAASNFIVLDFWGNLYPCEALPAVANIREIGYDFAQVVNDSRWHRVIKDIRKGKCHCTHMCFLASSLNDSKKKLRWVKRVYKFYRNYCFEK